MNQIKVYARFRLIILWVFVSHFLYSQENPDSLHANSEAEVWIQGIEQAGMIDYAAIQEEFLNQDPGQINLSRPDPLDLLKIPGLSPNQIDILHTYILTYGPLVSLWELCLLKEFDSLTIEKIRPWLKFEHANRLLLRRQRDEIALAGNPEGKFRIKSGLNLTRQIRLAVSYKNDSLGIVPLTMPALNQEMLHASLCYNTSGGEILIVGDYRAAFGQGLCYAPGASFFAGSDDWRKRSTGVRPYSGYSGFGSNRGVAGKFKWKGLAVEGFSSVKSEEKISGIHLAYGKGVWKAGLTAITSLAEQDTSQGDPLYTYHNYKGGFFQALSFDYVAILGKTAFYGEVCKPDGMPAGLLSGIRYDPIPRLGMQVLYRYYPSRFSNPYATANSMEGKCQNEQSLMMQIRAAVYNGVSFNATLDLGVHPWYQYRVDHSSFPSVFNFQVLGKPARTMNLDFLWRWKTKSQNITDETTMHLLDFEEKHSTQLRITQQLSDVLRFTSRAVFVFNKTRNTRGEGYLLSQDLLWKIRKNFKVSMCYSLFETDGFDQRIYLFENNVPELYSMRAYYGRGDSFTLIASWQFFRRFQIYTKLGMLTDSRPEVQFSLKVNP